MCGKSSTQRRPSVRLHAVFILDPVWAVIASRSIFLFELEGAQNGFESRFIELAGQ